MWPNPQKTADLVTIIEEILNGKFHFLCNDVSIFGLFHYLVPNILLKIVDTYKIMKILK